MNIVQASKVYSAMKEPYKEYDSSYSGFYSTAPREWGPDSGLMMFVATSEDKSRFRVWDLVF